MRGGLRDALRLGAGATLVAVLATWAGFAYLGSFGVAPVLARSITQPDQGQSDLDMGRPDHHQQITYAPIPPLVTAAAVPLVDTQDGTPGRVPRVDAFLPAGDAVTVNEPIVISFTQPMAPASVAHSFVIKPSVDGRLTWTDDYTMRFEPYRLAYATTYEVQVRGRSTRGLALAGTWSWRFTTAAAPPDVIPTGRSTISVPILTYHYIRVNPDSRDRLGFALSVTPSDFAAQMDWLARSGYHPITTEDLYGYLAGSRGLPSKPVALTFDDGYEDFYSTALPILRSHEFKAVAYVVSGFIDKPGYMTGVQIVEASRSGVEIGSHTVDHANLARLSPGGVQYEVTASKQALEKLLGHPVDSFCYPSGRFSPAVMSAVAAAGYHDATTTRFGFVNTLADRYMWGRLRVSGGKALSDFATAVIGAS